MKTRQLGDITINRILELEAPYQSSANLACLHARGEIDVNGRMLSRSIIDSEFEVELRGTTEVAGREAVLPRISGRAWIFGMHQLGIDPSDPFPSGYTLSDTWGPFAGKL